MRKVSIDQVIPGMKLGRPIYSPDGNMLLSQGLKLSEQYINKLKEMNYMFMWIEDTQLDDVTPEEVINVQTTFQVSKCVKEITDLLKQNKNFPAVKLQKAMKDVLDDIINNRHLLINLQNIRRYNNDDFLFNHSVNVTVVSVAIGLVLGYSISKLHDLGLGVILHDVGKTQLPSNIAFDPTSLSSSDFELYKNHTWAGYEYIKKNGEIKITSAHVALQHHEKFDGSGYPRGLKGNDIIEYARIAAIADAYDILSNGRGNKKGLPPHKVYEELLKGSGTYFDSFILDRFIQKIALYPQSTKIRISNGMLGLVVRQNPSDNKRPIVRLFWDQDGNKLSKPEDIDLLKETSLTITDVIND